MDRFSLIRGGSLCHSRLSYCKSKSRAPASVPLHPSIGWGPHARPCLQVQWNLLMEQQASNVWRKRAFSAMKSAHDQFGKDVPGSDKLLGCLDTFRERVDHNVENTVPTGLVSEPMSERANQQASQ